MLKVESYDFANAGKYILVIEVFYEAYTDSVNFPTYEPGSKQFEIHVNEYCVPTSIDQSTLFNPSELIYTIGEDD